MKRAQAAPVSRAPPPVRPRRTIRRLHAPPPPWTPANPVLRGIRLGTAVKLWIPGRWRHSVQEGVVVAVVPPGMRVPCPVRNERPASGWRNLVPHYVVQCGIGRVLCRATEMDVVAL